MQTTDVVSMYVCMYVCMYVVVVVEVVVVGSGGWLRWLWLVVVGGGW